MLKGFDLIMCGEFCIWFADVIIKSKSMTDFTTVFSPNKFNVNDEVILKYFLIEISTKMVETYTYGTIKMYLQLVIHEREKTSKRLDKYIAGFDYLYKTYVYETIL